MKHTPKIITKKTQWFLIACLAISMSSALQAQVSCVTINCPADTTVQTAIPSCNAIVNYTIPTAADNCCAPPTSVPGYNFAGTYNGHTYFISTSQLIWTAANAAAIAAGGNLVSINSAAENAFVVSIAGGQFVLIGGHQNHLNPNYTEPAGGWEWPDGSSFSNYINWTSGEPSNAGGDEDFIEFYPDGTWNDLPDTYTEYSIVEFSHCINNSLTPVLFSGLASGSTFPVGTNTITYTASDLNGNTDTCRFNVNVIDNGVTIAAAPSGTVCQGTGITFTATPFNGGSVPSYQWMINGINVGTDSFAFTTNTLANGDLVTCKMTSNASLCVPGAVTSNTIVAAISVPVASITSSGPILLCKGDTVKLSANTGPGLTYQWSSVYVPIPGETGDSYDAHYRGWFRVTVTDAIGCTAISNMIHVYVDTLPPNSVSASGPLTFCQGQSVTLTAYAGTSLSYQWTRHKINISGATNISFAPATDGNYRVIVTNSFGCSRMSQDVVVTVNPLPAAVITPGGSLTFCQGDSVMLQANSGTGLTYQWKKNNGNINGATLQNYTAETPGTYKVIVTDQNGCSKTSAAIIVIVNCRLENYSKTETADQLSIFPNPADGFFTIEMSGSNIPDGVAEIEITNTLGQNVYTGTRQYSDGELLEKITPGSDWSKGIYFIKIKLNGAGYNGKVVLQ